MSPALSSLRVVVRGLLRSPLFTSVTILTLAVGLGAATAVFSVVHGVLLQPLPFDQPDRLIEIGYTAPDLGFDEVPQSPAVYFTLRDESRTLTDIGLYRWNEVAVTGRGEPEQIAAMQVTDGVFPLLGVPPIVGRTFTAEDDSPGTAPTVLLTHGYWQKRFAGDRSAVGQTLLLDGEPTEIIGVLPPDLHFLDYDPELFIPFQFDQGELFIGNFSYGSLARLAPGASLTQASDEVARILPLALDRFPMAPGFSRQMFENAGLSPRLRPLAQEVLGDVGNVLWVLLGTVGIVLLIACANVANLFLARAEARRQQLAVRSALGAGRRHIAAGLLVESLVLSLAGGIVGVGLAAAGVRLLTALAPRGLPRLDEIAIDPTVLLFALALSVAAAALFGALPALRLAGGDLVPMLKEGGRGADGSRRGSLARSSLVASQVALALVLVVGCGLMVRSFQALHAADPGFRQPEELLTFRLSIPSSEVEDVAQVALRHEEILRRLKALPGVTSAALTTSTPMGGWSSNDPIFVEDFPTAEDTLPPLRRFKWIGPGYFATMGNRLVAGRDVSWDDIHHRRPVVVISERLAREYWPDPRQAVGRRLKPYPHSAWREIVGVAGDEHDAGIEEGASYLAYWPMVTQDFFTEGVDSQRSMAYVLRSTRVGSQGFLDEVRATVWSVDPHLPLADVWTQAELLDRSLARTSFTLVMLLIAAGTALLIGCIGIYGVTSYLVTQRRREIGVRMALGARPRDVSRLVLGHGLRLAVLGSAAGLVSALALTRLMKALLHGVNAVDPTTFAAAGAAVVSLALVASYLPARRAAGVDPIETLRWQ